MAPRTKVAGSLMGFTASDSEADFDDVLESAASRQVQPVKRPRGRPAASKVTKPAQKNARSNSVRPSARAQASPRRALADKNSNAVPTRAARTDKPSPADDIDMLRDQHSSPVKQTKLGRGRPRKETRDSEPLEHNEVEEAQSHEVEAMEIEPDRYPPLEIDDNASDATVRRKLGDLTRKYESLEARHRELHKVGIVEAERNFERLQKQADESAAAATKLINELKAELASQKALAKKGEEVRKQLDKSESKCAGLQSKVSGLDDSLSEARSEIKKLSMKLAATRSAEAGGNVPGSALKAGAAGHRPVSSDLVRAQAKQDLYEDLTGLIIRDVDQGEEEDVYDCIQTGRNGTLHFHLTLDKVGSYDNVHFTYQPQFDDSRDGELMDMLPELLVDEIEFPRTHGSKFYARVMKALIIDEHAQQAAN